MRSMIVTYDGCANLVPITSNSTKKKLRSPISINKNPYIILNLQVGSNSLHFVFFLSDASDSGSKALNDAPEIK